MLAAVPRYCDLGNTVPATQYNCDMNISPPASPAPLPFFFFRVSDRLIKDYNLSSSEGQRIGLAISNLIFFQVAAELQCVVAQIKYLPRLRSLKFPCASETLLRICPVTQPSSFSFQELGER